MTSLAISDSSDLHLRRSVHVWVWELDRSLDRCEDYQDVLSEEERTKASRFYLQSHRQKFIVSHAAVRMILAGYFACDASSIRFGLGRFGKPFVKNQATNSSLRFNLSHTSRLGAVAVSAGIELGLDIEEIRPIDRDVARSLSPNEQLGLAAFEAQDWLLAFYRCWSRKEAVLKAEGVGLNTDLASFDVSVHTQLKTHLLKSQNQAFTTDWQIVSLEPANAHVGAIALASEPTEIKFFQFNECAFP